VKKLASLFSGVLLPAWLTRREKGERKARREAEGDLS
jgi:hypothetical protein